MHLHFFFVVVVVLRLMEAALTGQSWPCGHATRRLVVQILGEESCSHITALPVKSEKCSGKEMVTRGAFNSN